MNNVATFSIPSNDRSMHAHGLGERLVALRVVCVDGRPGRQDEHVSVKGVLQEHCLQLFFVERCRLANHSQRLNNASIKEYPTETSGCALELLNVSAKNLVREGRRLGPWSLATFQPFRNDGASGLLNSSVTEPCKLTEQRCLPSTWPSRDNDAMHSNDVFPSRLTFELSGVPRYPGERPLERRVGRTCWRKARATCHLERGGQPGLALKTVAGHYGCRRVKIFARGI